MSKKPHVLGSLFVISILVLPFFLIFGVLFPLTMVNTLESYVGDCSIVFYVLGLFFLISFLLPPPPDKKRRTVFFKKIRALFRRFFKPKLTEEIIFTDDIIQFGSTDSFSGDSSSEFQDFHVDLTHFNASIKYNCPHSTNLTPTVDSVELPPIKPKIRSRSRIKIRNTFSELDLFEKNINFGYNPILFLKNHPQTPKLEDFTFFGGIERDFQPTFQFSLEGKQTT